MAITIGSNSASLSVQRSLAQSSESLGRSYEKLSSGMRINRASDDAAGLAISSGLRATATVQSQAVRNISDGISAIEIASQGVSTQQQVLQRMYELAEQAANGTYSYAQHQAMQREYGQLMSEYERIGNTAEFNGIKLLNGSKGTLTIQSGTGGGVASGLEVGLACTSRLGGEEWVVVDYSRNGTLTSLDATKLNTYLLGTDSTLGPRTIDHLANVTQGAIMASDIIDSNGKERDLFVLAIPIRSANSGYQDRTGVWVIEADQAGNFERVFDSGAVFANFGAVTPFSFSFADGATGSVYVDLQNVTIKITDIEKPGWEPARRTALSFTGIEGSGHARQSLDVLQNRMDDLAQATAALGAAQSRLETQYNAMSAMRLEYESAASRITDADMAQETANAARQAILEDAGSAVLAQVNQTPALALTLLR